MSGLDEMHQISEAQRQPYEQANGTATSEVITCLTNAYQRVRKVADNILQSIEVERTRREEKSIALES
jgi:hypothetical protein